MNAFDKDAATQFLRDMAERRCECEDDDRADRCERCLARESLDEIGSAPTVKNLRAALFSFVRGSCWCNFPERGESGVIVDWPCRVREIIDMPPSDEHKRRASNAEVAR